MDRDEIQLENLPPAQRFLDTRIFQIHELWHLVVGYETTAISEVSISAFQLLQFGHAYSAILLPFGVSIAVDHSTDGACLLVQFIAEAWKHGRSSPAFMAIKWEQEWHRIIKESRRDYVIYPFAPSMPQNSL